MKKIKIVCQITFILTLLLISCNKENVIKTLIITGQGDHNWEASSPVLKQILDETGMFSCKILTAPGKGSDMSGFTSDFSKYKLVVIDYNGNQWPEKTRDSFNDFVRNGGGVVIYHASIGFCPFSDTTPVPVKTQGKIHEYEIRTVVPDHPVTAGLPVRWLHAKDELFQGLNGSLTNTTILATAYADTAFGGTGKHEPVMLATTYGKGRVFTTLLGHADKADMEAMQCAGFIITLQRGAEWAATGAVTQPVPYDFPDADLVFLRKDYAPMNIEKAFENLGNYDIPKSTKYYTFIQDQIRRAGGNAGALLDIEKRMVSLLRDPKASKEAKKLVLRELSWMGSDYCIQPVKNAASDQDIKEDAEYALTRLQGR